MSVREQLKREKIECLFFGLNLNKFEAFVIEVNLGNDILRSVDFVNYIAEAS